VPVEEVDYVCCHANSSPLFDRKEVAVLNGAFGDAVSAIPVSSIKAVLGHPFGASGAFQVAAASIAIKKETIPPTHNLVSVDPDCYIDCLPVVPLAKALRNVLVTSYGYGGVNAYMLLRSTDGEGPP
jgi:3-oxoacyl-(acyl-carrier-protein) synthase